VPALKVEVIDTVGAGDAFMAGLVNALCSADVSQVARSADGIAAVLSEAMLVAALTVTRAGANPPTAAELLAARSGMRPS
jgi:fructokinase